MAGASKTSGTGAALLVAGILAINPAFAQTSTINVSLAAEQTPDAIGQNIPELSAQALEFRDALLAELEKTGSDQREDIASFYEQRGYERFWTSDNYRLYETLRVSLAGSDAHGLPSRRYHLDDVSNDPDAQGAVHVANREVAAMVAYLSYGRDVSSGILTPVRIDEEISIRPDRPEASELLASLYALPLQEALESLPPSSPEYSRLMSEKSRLENLIGSDVWGEEVESGPTLHPGESSPRVAQIRSRLALLGFRSAEGDLGEFAFDDGLKDQVMAFQRENGLVDDGVVGQRTLRAMNASVEDRLRQVLVNLERVRWMNRDLGSRHIAVNIPDYTVKMVDDGQIVWQSRTVVGKAEETRTPEFSDTMTYFVVNPTWHIPDSIATRVYLPKLRRDPSVLRNSNMRLFTRSGVEINPRLVNFTQYGTGNFPFRIKQNPSSANALGRVKFMFPNQFSIYLHDTPSRELFAKDGRAFSNGCIRLEQPLELAYVLMSGTAEDPATRFDGWLQAKTERHVNLEDPVQVHIMYRTAWVDEAGKVQYRDDVYGRDLKVFKALEAAGVKSPTA